MPLNKRSNTLLTTKQGRQTGWSAAILLSNGASRGIAILIILLHPREMLSAYQIVYIENQDSPFPRYRKDNQIMASTLKFTLQVSATPLHPPKRNT